MMVYYIDTAVSARVGMYISSIERSVQGYLLFRDLVLTAVWQVWIIVRCGFARS